MSHNSASLASMSPDLSTSTSHHVILAHRFPDLLSCGIVTSPHCSNFSAHSCVFLKLSHATSQTPHPPTHSLTHTHTTHFLPLILNSHKRVQRSGFVYASGRTEERVHSAEQSNVNLKMPKILN